MVQIRDGTTLFERGYVSITSSFGGADIDSIDNAGLTPIFWCRKHGLLETAQVPTSILRRSISKHGFERYGSSCRLGISNTNEFTALHYTVLSQNAELVKMCLGYRDIGLVCYWRRQAWGTLKPNLGKSEAFLKIF